MNKVLFVIKAPASGGAETYLLRFMKHIPGDYTVLCKGGCGGELESEYVKVCKLVKEYRVGYFNPINYIKLYKYFRKNKFDVICDFQGNFAGFVLLCAKLAGIKKRIAFYRESRNKFPNDPLRKCYKWAVTKAMIYSSNKILANSYEALNHFHPNWKETTERYEVIYNGFDCSALSSKTKEEVRLSLNIPIDAFVIGHSGRYCEAKNHEMIMKVAYKLCKDNPHLYFVLMGRGVRERYEAEVQSRGLSNQIKILGYRSDVLDVLRSLDLFYFPSLTEGQPNALIEAMANNLPFVASNIEPIKETVPSELEAILVSPTDFEANYMAVTNAIKNCREGDVRTVGKWTLENFDADKLFDEFKKELL